MVNFYVSRISEIPLVISIDESFVDAAAPNADTAKNGRGLVLKKKFGQARRSIGAIAPVDNFHASIQSD